MNLFAPVGPTMLEDTRSSKIAYAIFNLRARLLSFFARSLDDILKSPNSSYCLYTDGLQHAVQPLVSDGALRTDSARINRKL